MENRIIFIVFLWVGLMNAQEGVMVYSPDSQIEFQTETVEKKYPVHLIDSVVKELEKDWVLKNADWGFCLYDPKTQKVIYERNADKAYVPASTTKLISSESALFVMGENFKWKTQLLIPDNKIDSSGTLQGDIKIIWDGDPTMGLTDIGSSTHWSISQNFIDALRSKGIKKINGNLIIETVVFKDTKTYDSKLMMDRGNYYSLIPDEEKMKNFVDINMAEGEMYSEENMKRVEQEENELTEDEIAAIIMEELMNSTKLVPINEEKGSNKFIPSPPFSLGRSFVKNLSSSGIPITGSLKQQSYSDIQNTKETPIYTYQSPELKDLIFYVNQRSNNKYAEILLDYVGYMAGGEFTKKSSKNQTMNHLYNVRFDFDGFNLADGSGLSYANKVSPKSQVKYLTYIMDQPYYNTFFNSLPQSGYSGTLRRMFVNSPMKGKIHAKTGTLRICKALAGYVDTPDGDRLVFSLLINHFSGSVSEVKKRMEKLLNTIDQF